VIEFANTAAAGLFAALIIIIILHLLLQRREERVVSSTYLFRELTAVSSQLNRRLRLRFSWLLLAQLLAAAFLVMAVMQPDAFGLFGGERTVVVVDASASMQAEDVTPNRFGEAVSQAQDYVSERSGQDTAVLAAAAEPTVVQGFTSDAQRLRTALDGMAPSEQTVDMEAALRVAQAMIGHGHAGRIVVFTDASFEGASMDLESPLEVVTVGQSSDNVGIVGLDAVPAGRSQFDVMARIGNFSGESKTVGAVLDSAGGTAADKSVTLEAGEIREVFFQLEVDGRQEFVLSLESGGDLRLDDQVSLTLGLEERPRVLLVTPGNVFLERALLSYPDIRLFTRESVSEPQAYDLVVFDRVQPSAEVERAAYFNVLPPDLADSFGLQSQNRSLTVSSMDRTHRLFRFLNLGDLRASDYRTVERAGGIESLVDAGEGSVIAAYEDNDQRWVFVGFDLYDSNFPLSVDFPLFIGNVLEWLGPEAVEVGPVLSPEESDIGPRWDYTAEIEAPGAGRPAIEAARISLWPYVLFMTVLLIGAEWFLFDRSSGGKRSLRQ